MVSPGRDLGPVHNSKVNLSPRWGSPGGKSAGKEFVFANFNPGTSEEHAFDSKMAGGIARARPQWTSPRF